MLRRMQQIDTQLLRRRGCKGAAMSVFAGTFVCRSPVRLSGFPIHMLVGNPECLDVHAIENRCKLMARGRDLAAARPVTSGMHALRRQQEKQEQEKSRRESESSNQRGLSGNDRSVQIA